MKFRSPWVLVCVVAAWAVSPSSFALDLVDPIFAPVIRGPGTVRALAWHQGSERLYVSVNADKLNGQMLATSLVRFDSAGTWEAGYAPVLNGAVSQIKVLPNGKVIIAGSFTTVDGHATNRVARLLSDGSVDTTFTITGDTPPSNPTALAVAPDGTIYVGTSGYAQTDFTSSGYITVWPKLLYKISASGAGDVAFEPDFGMVDTPESSYFFSGSSIAVNALLITPSGEVLAGGNFTAVNGEARTYLAKLSSSGSLDTAYDARLSYTESSPNFGFFGSTPLGVSALIDAEEGKVYAAGTFNTVSGYLQSAVAKLQADGTLDPAFRVNFTSSFFSSSSHPGVSRVVRDSTGRLVLVGAFESIDGISKSGVARVDAYGRLDNTFGSNFGNQDHAVLLPDDGIAFGRTGSLASNGVVQPPLGRVSAAGVADPTFRPDLRNRRSPDWMAARPAQGPIVGSIWIKEVNGQDTAGGVAALGLDGSVDSAFTERLAINGTVRTSLVLPNGRILLGGSFTTVGGLSRPRLALVEPDGSPVAAFNLGTGPASEVRLLKLLPSGKVLVGGFFTTLDGETCQNVALLDLTALGATEGIVVEEIIEARFGTDLLYSDVKSRLTAALVDGAISLSINSTNMGGDPAPGATKFLTVRFRTNRGERTAKIRENSTLKLPSIAWDSGLIDRNFRPRHTESLSLTDAAEQADGKILLLGSFSNFAGQGISRLVRVDPNGELDTTFIPHTQFSSFSPDIVRLDAAGRIYLAGSSMSLTGGSSSRQIHRLTANGVIDPSFVCPAFLSFVEALQITPDGSIWCAGSFFSSSASERKRIARLLPSGAVDTRFNAGESASSTVNNLFLEAPNKLWISGSFTSVQGSNRDGVALINLSVGIAPLAQVVPSVIAAQEGKTARFELANTGTGESYVWRRNGVVVTGATTAALDVPNVEPHHAGAYEAEVSNSVGNTRSQGVLTVHEATLAEWLGLRGMATNAGAVDSDGDGWTNEEEYLVRTDPNDARSTFATKLEPLSGGIMIRWPSYVNRTYVVEESDDLSAWGVISPTIPGDGTEQSFTVPMDSTDRRLFWRVRITK